MKLEVGKKYKTDGGPVFIIIGQHPVSNLFLAACGDHAYIYTFDEEGRGVNNGFNLTTEYKEPRVGYVNVYENVIGSFQTSITLYQTREEADMFAVNPSRAACIKITEGQFDD